MVLVLLCLLSLVAVSLAGEPVHAPVTLVGFAKPLAEGLAASEGETPRSRTDDASSRPAAARGEAVLNGAQSKRSGPNEPRPHFLR